MLYFLQHKLLALSKYLYLTEFHHRIVDGCGNNAPDEKKKIDIGYRYGGVLGDSHRNSSSKREWRNVLKYIPPTIAYEASCKEMPRQ